MDTTAGARCWMSGDAASIDALVAELEAAGEMPTILVNNAAITRDTLLLRMKPEDWDAVIATNLTAVFRLSKACLRRMMKERRGRIVNLTSVVGVDRQRRPGQLRGRQSGPSRLHQVARARGRLARHHRQRGRARVHRHRHDSRPWARSSAPRCSRRFPPAGSARAADVAAAVLFLASPQASYITGETLHVNGGMYMP